ncbi:ribosomal protein L7/L12 [Cellulomonas edaphi]|uniref:Ribosomal protein L7/L12 n=1 Tax=Cellulomonas edaphi TaxID=3053468 RepID=A0ABT7S9P7_9CELL|nr:ribosomal protein L7/L12 [Cellulomons edaphi]MDM7832348.1 ribosomal protein L7/L12 [Cellulomons edaphi]
MTTIPVVRVMSAIRRALPRVAGVSAGTLLTMPPVGSDLLMAVGIFVTYTSLPARPLNWWRYIVTGTKPRSAPHASYTQPGDCAVELHAVRDLGFELPLAIRHATGVTLEEATSMAENTPATIATHLSRASAQRVRRNVEQAGGVAVVTTVGDPLHPANGPAAG